MTATSPHHKGMLSDGCSYAQAVSWTLQVRYGTPWSAARLWACIALAFLPGCRGHQEASVVLWRERRVPLRWSLLACGAGEELAV